MANQKYKSVEAVNLPKYKKDGTVRKQYGLFIVGKYDVIENKQIVEKTVWLNSTALWHALEKQRLYQEGK